MARLIDADAFSERCGNYYAEEGPAEGFIGTVGDLIAKQPVIDAQPVRHGRWIPCSERMPEQSGIYLAYFTFKDGTHATDIAYINTGCGLGSITHWMPLPEPPEGGD